MKRVVLVIFCLSLLVAGGITAYVCLAQHEHPDYSSGLFVDGSDIDGYEGMYCLYTNV